MLETPRLDKECCAHKAVSLWLVDNRHVINYGYRDKCILVQEMAELSTAAQGSLNCTSPTLQLVMPGMAVRD